MTYCIHWFRRDLRVAGNSALQWAWRAHAGRVLGFFCFDGAFLSRPDFSVNRFAFFLDTLVKLRSELRELGADLLVLDTGPRVAFERVFQAVKVGGKPLPRHVSYNRDYEPFARERDTALQNFFEKECGIAVHTERDHLLIEPHEISKGKEAGAFYQVYSPFARQWLERLATPDIQERIAVQQQGIEYLERSVSGSGNLPQFRLCWEDVLGNEILASDKLDEYRQTNRAKVTIPIPEAGSRAALQRLKKFAASGLSSYTENRDIPSIEGTSQISMYLKNGSLTPAQVMYVLGLGNIDGKSKDSRTSFLKELVWREFYYHILYWCPRVENGSFVEKYNNILWDDNEDLLRAWQKGRTGYPIVDAGMRQLSQTGWMHNRVRMIVASFLTKDLHISWRWGERHFMRCLLDGDLACNNGGWQWAASTGCDPQPYFRVFNPTLQGKKFDPQGVYVKTFMPELSHVPEKYIHEPHTWQDKIDYPKPVVDHGAEKARALRMYTGSPTSKS